MADNILAFPTEQRKTQEELRVAAERWAAALRAALAMRRDDPPRRMTTAPEIKALAQQIGPIAARFGIDSAVTARAVAALVTMCHPVVLACMLANAPMGRDGVPPRRKRGRR